MMSLPFSTTFWQIRDKVLVLRAESGEARHGGFPRRPVLGMTLKPILCEEADRYYSALVGVPSGNGIGRPFIAGPGFLVGTCRLT
jgi:hypothetical protein